MLSRAGSAISVPKGPRYAERMARPAQTEIQVRLVVCDPIADVLHSLQDKRGMPVAPARSKAGEPISFDFPIRLAAGPRFLGEHVRSEGPKRRFVYIAVGRQAGDPESCWDRRMKIDVHDVPRALLAAATAGWRLEGTVHGSAKDGGPACATVRVKEWKTTSDC